MAILFGTRASVICMLLHAHVQIAAHADQRAKQPTLHIELRYGSLQAGLALVPAAMQTFIMYFVALDPFKQQAWQCQDPADPTCQAALRGSSHSACHLPPETWHWQDRCKHYPHNFSAQASCLLKVAAKTWPA